MKTTTLFGKGIDEQLKGLKETSTIVLWGVGKKGPGFKGVRVMDVWEKKCRQMDKASNGKKGGDEFCRGWGGGKTGPQGKNS